MARYNPTTNAWEAGEDVELVAAGEVTADANGDAVYLGEHSTLRLTLDVTAVGDDADETLDVTVEHSEDGATGWAEIAAFTQATQPGAATSERKIIAGCDRYVRAVIDVEGTTPSFTFSLTGEAV